MLLFLKERKAMLSAEYKQTQRTREYICWPHYREFPNGEADILWTKRIEQNGKIIRLLWLRGKCRCRWKMAWERCSRDKYRYQWSDHMRCRNGDFRYCSDCNRTACYSGRVSWHWQIIGSLQCWLDYLYGLVPDKVSDREAGTNRSGNTSGTRLLYMRRRFFYLFKEEN